MGFYHLFAWRRTRSKLVRYHMISGSEPNKAHEIGDATVEEDGEHVCEARGCCTSTNSMLNALLWSSVTRYSKKRR